MFSKESLSKANEKTERNLSAVKLRSKQVLRSSKYKGRATLKKISEKLIYYLVTFVIFFLLFKFVAWLENAYIPLNTQTQLISGIITIPAIVILSFILSSLLFRGLKESK